MWGRTAWKLLFFYDACVNVTLAGRLLCGDKIHKGQLVFVPEVNESFFALQNYKSVLDLQDVS